MLYTQIVTFDELQSDRELELSNAISDEIQTATELATCENGATEVPHQLCETSKVRISDTKIHVCR